MKRALLIVALAACGKDGKDAPKPLDDLGEVPAFTLRDQTGGELTEAWLRGHVTIIDFVFTRCDTICPLMSLRMQRLGKQLPEVQLLSFSVDPDYDQPPVLAKYAEHYDADPARWRFVTGAWDQVRAIAEDALMTAMEPTRGTTPSGAPDIRHGGHFLLVDAELHIRGVYDSADDARLKALALDARRL